MPNPPNLPREIYLSCLYKPTILSFYDVKVNNSQIRFITSNDNLIPLEPEKDGEWKQGLVGMMVAEDREDKVLACLTDVLLGEVNWVLIPKDMIFNSK